MGLRLVKLFREIGQVWSNVLREQGGKVGLVNIFVRVGRVGHVFLWEQMGLVTSFGGISGIVQMSFMGVQTFFW